MASKQTPQKEYRTITNIKGPLVFVEKTHPVGYGELVQLRLPNGDMRRGQVLDTSGKHVVVQVFEGTTASTTTRRP
jgi:V/A-type H+/Na+-transporting ATPase subunit B